MSNASPAIAPGNGLPQPFVTHMEREEAALAQMLEALREIRAALLKNDLNAFTSALEKQAKAAQFTEELQQQRRPVIVELATAHGLDGQSITLRELGEAIAGNAGQWIHRCRERMLKAANEVQLLNRHNARMVHQSVEITRLVMAQLTSEDATGTGYNASGSRQDTVGGSMFELGG